MPDRVDVPALLRRVALAMTAGQEYDDRRLDYVVCQVDRDALVSPANDAAYLDRLADAVEAWHVELEQDYDRSLVEQPNAGLRMLALLRGEVAP